MDVVVVSYNAGSELRGLAADAVFRTAFDRVIVVDNASVDASRDIAAAARFEVVASERNLGFAAAANRGAQHVSSKHFLVMNPDVRFNDVSGPARLSSQLDDPTVALVGPALILPNGEIQDSARRVPSPADLVVRRFLGRQPDAVQAVAPVDVEWVVGGCVAIKRCVFDAVGGFDDRFFLYFEDVDLGVRVRRAGQRVRYDPTIRVRHVHGRQSRGPWTSSATRHHVASALRFYARHPGCLKPHRA